MRKNGRYAPFTAKTGVRFPLGAFENACKVAKWLGFIGKGGDGSHNAYSRPGEPEGLNFQNLNGKIPPYQARQLIVMINRYEDEI
jgi:hypothetical protein